MGALSNGLARRAVCTKKDAWIILIGMKDSSGKKHNGIAAAFWIAVAVALVIAFLVKQDHIIGVLKETAFFEHVFGREPDFIARHEIPSKNKTDDMQSGETIVLEKEQPQKEGAAPGASSAAPENLLPSDRASSAPAEQSETAANSSAPVSSPAAASTVSADSAKSGAVKPPAAEKTASGIKDKSAGSKSKPSSPPAAASETKPAAPAKMNQYLCFIAIGADGFVERKEVNRAVPKTNTPLTAALTALLEGPGIPELEKGYISLIPAGTKLLSASVQNKTAYINFSQEFAFNKYGEQGYLGQLMQVVYTATAFNTIDNVQFLIDGEKNEYLGSEGVWIGTPLARYNFK